MHDLKVTNFAIMKFRIFSLVPRNSETSEKFKNEKIIKFQTLLKQNCTRKNVEIRELRN